MSPRIFLACILVLLAGLPASAQTVDLIELPPYQPNIGTFLTAQGRVDIAAIRDLPFEGTLGFDGFAITFDPDDGEPVFVPEGHPMPFGDVASGQAFRGPCPGVVGDILAITFFEGKLIVGGTFTRAGDEKACNIAVWDGAAWSCLGYFGMNGSVRALAVHDGKLYAGGDFTTAGGDLVNRVTVWDDGFWCRLGLGVHENVTALSIYEGELVAGGQLGSRPDSCIKYIVGWDGNSWSVRDAVLRIKADQASMVFGSMR